MKILRLKKRRHSSFLLIDNWTIFVFFFLFCGGFQKCLSEKLRILNCSSKQTNLTRIHQYISLGTIPIYTYRMIVLYMYCIRCINEWKFVDVRIVESWIGVKTAADLFRFSFLQFHWQSANILKRRERDRLRQVEKWFVHLHKLIISFFHSTIAIVWRGVEGVSIIVVDFTEEEIFLSRQHLFRQSDSTQVYLSCSMRVESNPHFTHSMWKNIRYTSTSTSLYHRLINIDHIGKVIAEVFIFPFSRHFYFSMSRVRKQFLQFMNEKAQNVFDFGCCCHRHRLSSRYDCLARRWQLLQSYQFWRRRYKLSSQKLRFFRNRRPTFRQLIWTPKYEVIFTTFSETKHYKEPEGDSVKRLLSSSSMSGTFEAFIGL